MRAKKNLLSGKISRRNFLSTGAAGAMALPLLPLASFSQSVTETGKLSKSVEPIWKNKQAGMVYRQLGRTGFMVSEIVNGGNTLDSDSVRATELAMEMGLNYLDTAAAYGRGESEITIGKLLSSPSKRDKVFLTTKVSGFPGFRNGLYEEVFNGLPSGKKEALLKKAAELRIESGVDRPEYYVTYFNGQPRMLDGVFLCRAMSEEYGEKIDGGPEIEKRITESLEESLKRLNTDHVDILMCPHGSSDYVEISNPMIFRTFEKLKKQGKVSFLGTSTHNNMASVLRGSIDTGHYDVIMLAYNIVNHGFLDALVKEAAGKGMGIIAMKAANPFANRSEDLKTPAWRVEKLNHFIPGDMKLPMKAYLWVLQNPHLSAVISDMPTAEIVRENLSLVGKKMDFPLA